MCRVLAISRTDRTSTLLAVAIEPGHLDVGARNERRLNGAAAVTADGRNRLEITPRLA